MLKVLLLFSLFLNFGCSSADQQTAKQKREIESLEKEIAELEKDPAFMASLNESYSLKTVKVKPCDNAQSGELCFKTESDPKVYLKTKNGLVEHIDFDSPITEDFYE